MAIIYILAALLVVLMIFCLSTYNGIVKLNDQVKEAFATMDLYLKKRWDLIPDIVETVKAYANHEKDTLEKIATLTNSTDQGMSDSDKIEANVELSGQLGKLMAIAERYPELKSSQNFSNLTDALSKVEEDIAMARKFYNDSVRIYNNKIQMFPSNLIAKFFGYKAQEMFENDDIKKKP